MASHDSLHALSDETLIGEVKRLAGDERNATAALIRSLIEFDKRQLYLREGCSSLFTYCTQVLHLDDGAAYNRIEVARAAARLPDIVDAIADGSLTLTAVRLLAPHLSEDNHHEVLAAARHKGKREIESLVATLRPRPAVADVIRKLPLKPNDRHSAPDLPGPQEQTPAPVLVSRSSSPPPAVTQLAPERFKVQLTITRDTRDKVRRVQDLLRHSIPDGDLSSIFDRAMTLLLADLERRRCAATSSPRPAPEAAGRSRHIPAAIKRQVWQRDRGRCAFVGTTGRCRETGFLEFHHVEPYAVGGAPTVENIQLRCRAHNIYEARLFFERDADHLMKVETG